MNMSNMNNATNIALVCERDWPELMQTFILLPFYENQILLKYFFYHLKSVFRKNSFVCKLFKCPI